MYTTPFVSMSGLFGLTFKTSSLVHVLEVHSAIPLMEVHIGFVCFCSVGGGPALVASVLCQCREYLHSYIAVWVEVLC